MAATLNIKSFSRHVRHPVTALLLLIPAALLIAPLVSLGVIALEGDADIWPHLIAYVLPRAAVDTALLLAGVALVTAITGVGIAWLVTAYRFPARDAATWLLPLPLAIPTYVVAYVYVDVFDTAGAAQAALRALFGAPAGHDVVTIRSLGGAVFVMSAVLYPYVYLAARAMFQTQSASLIEMARSLGGRRWLLARDITLPLARPAIGAGIALALLEALNDIGASEYLGVRTLTLSIFTTWLNRSSLPGAAQIACLMLVVVAGLIALERRGRRRQRFTGIDRHPGDTPRIVLLGWRKWLATAACLLPITLGFLVPLAVLVRETVARGLLIGFDPVLVRHAGSTVLMAGAATAIALVLGFAAVMALRLVRQRAAAACVFIASLGYAVPGTVLALGLLSPLVAVDGALDTLATLITGTGIGLVLTGSSAAVVIAYVARFMTIPIGFAEAGLARISTELDDAARAAGLKPSGVARYIQLPLLRPALFGAGLLIFVDCLKELPATLLLRPLNVETLSTYVYQFATRGNFEEGALAALLIVLVGIGPVIWMVRHGDR